MQQKWKKYWMEVRGHALKTFCYYPPWIILFFSAVSYFDKDTKGDFWLHVAYSSIYCYAINASIFVIYSTFYALSRKEARRYIPTHLLLTCIGLLIGAAIADRTIVAVFDTEPSTLSQWLINILIGSIVGLGFIFFHAYTKTKTAMHALEKSTLETQYRTLKDQMQPHFLFNSLNGLSELIHQNTEEAAVMTTKLADLYRGILENSKNKTNTLSSELTIVEDYLCLQKLRFGKNIRYKIINQQQGDPYVPSLMVQTLVENAVKHGIARSPNGGEIEVEIQKTCDNWYRLIVRNSGGRYKEPHTELRGSGTGLENTRRRLDLLYEQRHEFSIGTNAQDQTEVSFQVSGERFE